jgi:ribosomal-protein-alanine N-acetyltransferase
MIKVRPIKAIEVEEVVSLRRKFFGDFFENRFRNYIKKNPWSINIAETERESGEILGYAFAYPWKAKEGVIHHICSLQENQKDIERALITHLEDQFLKNELKSIRIWISEEQFSLKDVLSESGFQLDTELVAFENAHLDSMDTHEQGNQEIQVLDFNDKFIDDILKIEVNCFKSSWHQTKEDFLSHGRKKNVWFCIALNHDHAIGYLQVTASEGLGQLGRVAVLPEFQGNKIGTRLIAEAMKWFNTQGVKKIKLRSPIDYTNAHNLYRKFGFAQKGKEFDYFKKLGRK